MEFKKKVYGGATNFISGSWHFLLLICFFFLKRWNDYFDLISFKSFLFVTSWFVFLGISTFLVSTFLLKSRQKAGLYTTFMSGGILFFFIISEVETFLFKRVIRFEYSFLSFILMLIVVFTVLFFTRRKLNRVTRFLNFLFTIFLFFEIVCIGYTVFRYQHNEKELMIPLSAIDSIDKENIPSVYLVVVDEYAGFESLESEFGFVNNNFKTGLEEEGFYIVKDAVSNYASTIFSVSSMLNGQYRESANSDFLYKDEAYKQALFDIYDNSTTTTFRKLGYQTFNLSPFSFRGYPAAYQNRFLPGDGALLLFPTVVDDLLGNFPAYFAIRSNNSQLLESYYQKMARINSNLIDSTLQLSLRRDQKPMFVYTHLLMPHAPYVFDSAGNVNLEFLSKRNSSLMETRAAYIEYLKYTNDVMLGFIQRLKKNSNGKSIIILMSDHGSKHAKTKTDKHNSLNSIFLPYGSYSRWYEGMSHVNQFKNVFSVIAGVDIVILNDTIGD